MRTPFVLFLLGFAAWFAVAVMVGVRFHSVPVAKRAAPTRVVAPTIVGSL